MLRSEEVANKIVPHISHPNNLYAFLLSDIIIRWLALMENKYYHNFDLQKKKI